MTDDTTTTQAAEGQAESTRLPVALSYQGLSQVEQAQGKSQVALYGNTYRTPVRASGTIRDPLRFREALSTLYQIVESDFRYIPKDRSAYLAYQRMKKQAVGMAAWKAQQQYFSWLSRNDPAAWTILDPIVSVHPDELAFEVFSKDEGTYARLAVDWKAFKLDKGAKPLYGTTNIDFSKRLFEGIQRMRSYREARFDIATERVAVQAGEEEVVEKKIQLPLTWVRGFLQVQSSAILPKTSVRFAPMDLYNALRHLRLNKDQKKGGRALRVELVPGEPPRLVLEPWELVLTSAGEVYKGKKPEVVRIWGRRRLSLMKRFLPYVDHVDLHLLGSGLPNFWCFSGGHYHFTLGLTGFTSSNWSQAVSFDLLLPRSSVVTPEMEKILDTLAKDHKGTLAALSKKTKVKKADALVALQQGSQQGKVIYDLRADLFRMRPLTDDPLDLLKLEFRNDRERVAHDLLAIEKAVRLTSEKHVHDVGVEIVGKVAVASERREYRPVLLLADDGRVRKAECTCDFYRKHKLKEGPCAHLIALRVAYANEQSRRASARGTRQKVSVESRTYVRRDPRGEKVVQLSLDHKRLKVRWGRRGEKLRLQNMVFNAVANARDEYFDRVDALEAQGYLDASAT